jgi:hypothetical protein
MGNNYRDQVRAARNAALRAIEEGNEEAFQRACRNLTPKELQRLRGDAARLSSELTGIIADRFALEPKDKKR